MGLARLRTKHAPEQLRKAKPLRNPAVTFSKLDDGSMLLEAPLAQQNGMAAWIAQRMKAPQTKKFELEPVGALVWELSDGQHTVDAISKKLREAYKMNRLEADASLNAFLQMLTERKLVSIQVPKTKQ
jgi:hypothetical protein